MLCLPSPFVARAIFWHKVDSPPRSHPRGFTGMVKTVSKAARHAAAVRPKPAPTQAQADGRLRAQDARQLKNAEKKIRGELGGLGVVNSHLEDDYIANFLKEKPGLKSYVCSLLRNGLLQKAMDGAKVAKVTTHLGKVVFRHGNGKWRQLGANFAVKLLGHLLDTDVSSWFAGDDALDKSIAIKACFYELGVSMQTVVPQGFRHREYEGPVMAVSKARSVALGERINRSGLTKDNLDQRSSYFNFVDPEDTQNGVCCSLFPTEVLALPYAASIADDWQLVDLDQYGLAMLVSEKQGIEQPLYKVFEKVHDEPVFDTPFDFSTVVTSKFDFDDSTSVSSHGSAGSCNNGGAARMADVNTLRKLPGAAPA